MDRPSRFEHARFVGDKRTQLVHDLDEWPDEAVVNKFVDLGVGIQSAPDTLAEARSRVYTPATPTSRRLHRKPRAWPATTAAAVDSTFQSGSFTRPREGP